MATEELSARKQVLLTLVQIGQKRSRWLGIYLVILGILISLTGVGVVIGWVPIYVGYLYIKSSASLTNIIDGESFKGITEYIKGNNRINILLILLFTSQVLFVAFYMFKWIYLTN